jgi:hypothetical protein
VIEQRGHDDGPLAGRLGFAVLPRRRGAECFVASIDRSCRLGEDSEVSIAASTVFSHAASALFITDGVHDFSDGLSSKGDLSATAIKKSE